MSYRVVIEIYVLLSIINAFLGVVQNIYEEGNPGHSLRSPFTGYPLAQTFTTLNTTGLQANLTQPFNSTSSSTIPWIAKASDAFQSFVSQINGILTWLKFFTAGYLIDLLTGIGIPSAFLQIVNIPIAFYLCYMVFVMVTNRLGY